MPVVIKIYMRYFSFIFLLSTSLIFAQNSPIYLKYEKSSEKIYLKEDGLGNTLNELIFRKNNLDDENIIFYIKDMMFVHNSNMFKETLCKKGKKFYEKLLNPKETEIYIDNLKKQYPFGVKEEAKKYPKFFIVVTDNTHEIILYEVKWQYYIE